MQRLLQSVYALKSGAWFLEALQYVVSSVIHGHKMMKKYL